MQILVRGKRFDVGQSLIATAAVIVERFSDLAAKDARSAKAQ